MVKYLRGASTTIFKVHLKCIFSLRPVPISQNLRKPKILRRQELNHRVVTKCYKRYMGINMDQLMIFTEYLGSKNS